MEGEEERGRVKKRKRGTGRREAEREITHLIKLKHRSLEAEPEGLPSSFFLLHVGIVDASPIKVTMLGGELEREREREREHE